MWRNQEELNRQLPQWLERRCRENAAAVVATAGAS